MAKQISAIKFTGKLGNIVGFKSQKGNLIIREKAASIANPQTEDQMAQRARFKLTSQLSAMLGEFGKIALKANGFKESDRGELNKMIMPNVAATPRGEAELNYKLSLISGTVSPNYAVDCHLSKNTGSFKFACEGTPQGTMVAKALLVYNKTTGQWSYVTSVDESPSISLNVPNSEIASCNAYGYAVLIMPTTDKGRAILDSIQGPDKNYRLLARRLSSENFAFTRNVSCANIDGVDYSDLIQPAPTTSTVDIVVDYTTESDYPEGLVISDGVNTYNMPAGHEKLRIPAFYGQGVSLTVSGFNEDRVNFDGWSYTPEGSELYPNPGIITALGSETVMYMKFTEQ